MKGQLPDIEDFDPFPWRHPRQAYGWVAAHTLCRLGWHSRRKIRKFDGGKLPLLCAHCRLIVGWDR
jgi:hypothetical protein